STAENLPFDLNSTVTLAFSSRISILASHLPTSFCPPPAVVLPPLSGVVVLPRNRSKPTSKPTTRPAAKPPPTRAGGRRRKGRPDAVRLRPATSGIGAVAGQSPAAPHSPGT